eukprot:m.43294 g.43294  ORF g.43294 m.43294 type:complete len:79 (-) comp9964_c0_seq1:665-901(-)
MNPKVRDLYKRLILVGRDYPGGWDQLRRRAKEEFFKNKDLKNEDVLKAVVRGRWYINNELVGVIQLKKYRTMAERYKV